MSKRKKLSPEESVIFHEEITAKCADCGAELDLSELRFLPETESYVRSLALALFSKKGEYPVAQDTHIDCDTLLCPTCFKKRFPEQKK